MVSVKKNVNTMIRLFFVAFTINSSFSSSQVRLDIDSGEKNHSNDSSYRVEKRWKNVGIGRKR